MIVDLLIFINFYYNKKNYNNRSIYKQLYKVPTFKSHKKNEQPK